MMPKACNFIAIIWVGATILSFIIKKNGLQTKNTNRIGQRQEARKDSNAQDSFRWITRGIESTDSAPIYPARDGLERLPEVARAK